jgi:protease PrsW
MAFCRACGAQSEDSLRFCTRCGAGQTTAGVAAAAAPAPVAAQPVEQYAPAPPPYAAHYPPPGMVAVRYQAYPGGPQQIYYVPAQGTHAHSGGFGFMEGVRSQIRNIASTDKLEGFSLRQTFSETFKRHGADAVEEYVMVGSLRTTPPIELVQTGWPRPWMFFRLLGILSIGFVALAVLFHFVGNEKLVPAIMFLGAFAMPLAVVVFIFEMNTPRNVSVEMLAKLFIIGGLIGMCVAVITYMVPIAGLAPGIVEESSKLLGVLLVARSARYKYELNGILFGATVGAGFACFETCGYAFDSLLQVLTPIIHSGHIGSNGLPTIKELKEAVEGMLVSLVVRGVLAPFGHMPWTAISAGAFWRVKQDRPVRPSMLLDWRFLKAFAIPVLMHEVYDSPVLFPKENPFLGLGLMGVTGVITWYVLFTMIQQGLRQVRNVQAAQLQATLAHVEATMQPGMGTYAMQPQELAGA